MAEKAMNAGKSVYTYVKNIVLWNLLDRFFIVLFYCGYSVEFILLEKGYSQINEIILNKN